jgi:hypothetical protein
VPERLAGRQVVCPGCGEIVPRPARKVAQPEARAAGPAAPQDDPFPPPPLPPAARLGVASLALGLVSVLLVCVPLVQYAAAPLSGVGLLLGCWGLARARAGGAALAVWLGGPARGYPLAGLAACLLALALALLAC